MNPEKRKKDLDPDRVYLGTELETFIVRADTFAVITAEESQRLMHTLIDKYGYQGTPKAHNGEIHLVEKDFKGHPLVIKLDVVYHIYEITTWPVSSLEELEEQHIEAYRDLRGALREHGFSIWPFAIDPASTGLLKLPFETKEIITDDQFYIIFNKLKNLVRCAHFTAHQVAIDVPVEKMTATLNALFRHLGEYITKFANCPKLTEEMFYKAGRYYYWNDCEPKMEGPKYLNGLNHIFPRRPFASMDDMFTRLWHSQYVFALREGKPCLFTDPTMTPHRWLTQRKTEAVDIEGNKIQLELTREDIELMFLIHWLDFKPHFDWDEDYTIDEFMEYYKKHDLDGFIAKHCPHAYIEVRCCAPHIEDNAMGIPKFFYKIFNNLDTFIQESESIDWQKAWEARNLAIGYSADYFEEGRDKPDCYF